MNRWKPRQVLECASLVALGQWRRAESATGLQGWRTPRRYRAIHRFMVPMHAEKRKGAFHEPRRLLGQIRVAYATVICPARCMVPMRDHERIRAFQTRSAWRARDKSP